MRRWERGQCRNSAGLVGEEEFVGEVAEGGMEKLNENMILDPIFLQSRSNPKRASAFWLINC